MDAKLGVVVIHGIGEQEPNFAAEFIEEISDRLGESAKLVRWKPLYWADIVEPKEAQLLDKLSQGGNLEWRWLRRFVVHFLADAVAYQRVPGENRADGVYEQLHLRVAQSLDELHAELGGRNQPLLVIAHSLGGHIISNYVWDQQHPHPARVVEGPRFSRAETLTAMISFGCNIPLFTLALPKVIPIAIPKAGAAPKPWLNMYDPDDVLGYPLAPLSAEYEKLVEDRVVNVGGLLTGWNPAAHNAYWTDNDVCAAVAQRISGLL